MALEDELEDERKMVNLAREESAYLKAELRALEQREGAAQLQCHLPVKISVAEDITARWRWVDAVGVKAGDGEYLKNIVLGYIEKTVRTKRFAKQNATDAESGILPAWRPVLVIDWCGFGSQGDRVQLLGVLGELLQFSNAEVARVQKRSSSWMPF